MTKHMSLESIISGEMGQAHKEKDHMVSSCVETRDGGLMERVSKEWERREREVWGERRCLTSTKTDKSVLVFHITVRQLSSTSTNDQHGRLLNALSMKSKWSISGMLDVLAAWI